MFTVANTEDQDEMQHNTAFHQGQHCVLKLKQFSEKQMISVKYYNMWPLNDYDEPSLVSCIISG